MFVYASRTGYLLNASLHGGQPFLFRFCLRACLIVLVHLGGVESKEGETCPACRSLALAPIGLCGSSRLCRGVATAAMQLPSPHLSLCYTFVAVCAWVFDCSPTSSLAALGRRVSQLSSGVFETRNVIEEHEVPYACFT